MSEQKGFNVKIRTNGAETPIVTIPKKIMEYEGLELGDTVKLQIIEKQKKIPENA
jgi:antitoxin component of MazEF toxin-antitoxin module